jgi:TonB-linked SusC/RagA family outer membrane protein
MKRTLLFLLLGACIFINAAHAQERVISGKVTSTEDGQPLPGVNVVIKGTTAGTVTDADGNFRLSGVPETGTLIFSFIGLTSQEIDITGRTTVDVQMSQDVQQLGEIVVTAQGIERSREALGYSVSEVGSEKLTQISEVDPLRSLQAKVPGVNIAGSSGLPGSSTRITIRGNTSLTGANQPLIVVDGIPYDNSYTISATQSSLVGGSANSSRAVDIDPANIESVTVLKGASAAALYGTRAANGVILYTTKAGSNRASQKGLEMTFNTSYSLEKIANLPDYQNKYGAGANGNYTVANGSWGPAFGGKQQTIPHPYWGAAFAAGFPDLQGTTIPYQAYPDNVKDFFNDGHLLENSLSITGGNQKGKITTVISRADQEGIIPSSSFERTSVSIGGNAQLDNKLNVGGSVTYTNSLQTGPILGANNAIGGASIFSRTLWLPRNFDLQGLPYINPVTNASVAGWLTGQIDNPYWSAQNNKYESKVDRINGFLNFSYDLNDWLSASYKVGLNTYTDRRQTTIRPGSVSSIGSGLGGVQDDYIWWQELESNFLISANRDLTEDISITANIGHNMNQRTSERQAYDGTQIVSFGIDDIDNVQNVIPAGGSYSRQRIVGVYGDVQFGFRDYLFLNVTGRNDWASTLPQGGNSFFYPSANASFVFTEGLNLNKRILNYGKLRAGVARVGNAPTPYNLIPTYNVNPGFGNVSQGLGVQFPFLGRAGALIGTTIADPNLTPEFTTEVEVGTELQFFDSRIGLDVALYKKTTTNQLGFVSTPAVTGYVSKYTNFGEVSNTGIEVGLNLTPIVSGDFKWDMYLAYSHNENIIEKLTEGVEIITIGTQFTGGVRAVHIPGQAYGVIEGQPVARDPETGKILVNGANGLPIVNSNAANRKILGNPNPKWIGGLTNTFSYKGLVLSVLMEMRYGSDIYSTTIQNMMFRGVTTDTEDREKLFILDGYLGDPTTFAPLLTNDGQKIMNNTQLNANALYFNAYSGADEFFVFDATYLRLREITLAYKIPKSLLSKTPFGAAQVSLSGRNLWLYTPGIPKGTNFDPESNTFGATNQQGFEFTNAPTARRYGVNISLTF